MSSVEETERDYFSKYSDELRVGYIGHLYPGKGGEVILQLAKRFPEMRFHIFGGFEEDIIRFSREAPQNIVTHGFVAHSTIPALLSSLDILLLPALKRVAPCGGSIGEDDIGRFMSPLKLFEYMASGRSIICSDLPVLREVLRHGETALLCEPDNIEHWSNALSLLLRDEELRQMLGANARREFEEHYTWIMRARRVLKADN